MSTIEKNNDNKAYAAAWCLLRRHKHYSIADLAKYQNRSIWAYLAAAVVTLAAVLMAERWPDALLCSATASSDPLPVIAFGATLAALVIIAIVLATTPANLYTDAVSDLASVEYAIMMLCAPESPHPFRERVRSLLRNWMAASPDWTYADRLVLQKAAALVLRFRDRVRQAGAIAQAIDGG